MRWVFKNLEELISGAALTIVLLVVIMNVFARFVLGTSILWSDEIATMGFVWCIFLGASACYKRGMHIGIDIVTSALKGKLRWIVLALTNTLLVVTNACLTYWSWTFAINAWPKLTGILQISYTFVDISATIAFGMMTIHAVRQLILHLRGGGEEKPPEEEVILNT